jgi:chromosomal replication initiator protein
MFLARRYTDSPLQTIGKSFNRYHATVLHSINAVEKEAKTKGPLHKQIKYLCRKIETGKF